MLRAARPLLGLLWALLAAVPAEAEPLTVGSISHKPAVEIRKFSPFAEYLARQLGPLGADQGKVVVARDIPQMGAFLKDGQVDLYLDSPFPALATARLSGGKPLLRRWKWGQAEYHAVLFARKGSGIARLEDLRGRMLAFETPHSSTGYFLARLALARAGLTLAEKADAQAVVRPDQVGYVFSQEDENTMRWVLRGRVAGGAMDDQSFTRLGRGILGELQVLHRSVAVPRQLVIARADLPAAWAARLREVLLAMEWSEEGRRCLQEFEGTTRFDPIPPGALDPLLAQPEILERMAGWR